MLVQLKKFLDNTGSDTATCPKNNCKCQSVDADKINDLIDRYFEENFGIGCKCSISNGNSSNNTIESGNSGSNTIESGGSGSGTIENGDSGNDNNTSTGGNLKDSIDAYFNDKE